MSDIRISLDSSGPRGEISVVRVDGVIDTMTATDLEKVMNSLLERNRYNVIIDLGGVDYISSAGWGIFISNIREIRQHNGDIKLARMIPNVYEIFELLEFDSILKAFESVEKAKTDFDGIRKASEEVLAAVPQAPPPASEAVESESPTKKLKIAAAAAPPGVLIEKEAAVKPARPTQQLRDMVLEMITKDPFLSISELKREIARKHPSLNLGWWKIWGLLRREKLLSKKKRFRRARLKSGGN